MASAAFFRLTDKRRRLYNHSVQSLTRKKIAGARTNIWQLGCTRSRVRQKSSRENRHFPFPDVRLAQKLWRVRNPALKANMIFESPTCFQRVLNIACGLCFTVALAGVSARAAQADDSPQAEPIPAQADQEAGATHHRVAVGARVSPFLGIGVESSVEVTRKSNFRGGFNFFTYDFDETKNNLAYNAALHLRSAEALYDWFPSAGKFHLSGGALLYNANQIKAAVSTRGGQSFTLGGMSYLSDPTNPVSGGATLGLDHNPVAPMGLLGWGNPIPRSDRHFGVNFEIGAVFIGSPQSTLSLTGGACVSAGVCVNAAKDPSVQSSVIAEKKKLDHDFSFLPVLPVISIGFSYRL
jgi:hypothetical protein